MIAGVPIFLLLLTVILTMLRLRKMLKVLRNGDQLLQVQVESSGFLRLFQALSPMRSNEQRVLSKNGAAAKHENFNKPEEEQANDAAK